MSSLTGAQDSLVLEMPVADSLRQEASNYHEAETGPSAARIGQVCSAKNSASMLGSVHMFCCNKYLHAE